jgi:2-keto-4-pentenoate hydratase
MAAAVRPPPSSEGTRVGRAAQLLLEARRTKRRLVVLPDDACPQSTLEAYAIQDAVLESMGVLGGWKVGAKSASAEPTCAPLPAALILHSPQRFAAGAFALNGIEAELAFTLSRDLPPRAEPYVETEMMAAVECVHPAIEVVDSRFLDLAEPDAFSLLADFQSNGALVLGTGVAMPEVFAAGRQSVHLDVDGVRIVDAQGSNPAGSITRLLAWLANHAAVRRGGLRRAEVVTTGSWTGMRFVAAGARVAAAFPGIGAVDIAF